MLAVVNRLTPMVRPKGGRGHPSPYESTHVRLPVPLKPAISRVVDRWYALVDADVVSPTENIESVAEIFGNDVLPYDDAVQEAHRILSQKKNAKISLGKLLTAIYQEETRFD